MEIIPFTRRMFGRRWRKRTGYQKLSPATKRSVKIVRIGTKRAWRIRLAPKLRLASPVRLWCRLKNAYVKMMLRIAGGPGTRKVRDGAMASSRAEFENRLVLEIYKSMVSSLELGYHPQAASS